jgi:predicted nucleic acid-binding protein
VIVDTSVWVQHLRKGDSLLRERLKQGIVTTHPFILGELACGNLGNRTEILGLLASLPTAVVVDDAELLGFVERERLYGRGIGWIDVHLLASARVMAESLWTLDRRLREAALLVGVAG